MKSLLKATLVFGIAVSVLFNVFPSTALYAKVKRLSITSAGDPLAIANFHVTKVVDERNDTTNIGYITTGASAAFLTADFKDGLTNEITGFLQENTRQHTGNEPVELHVLKYQLFEKSSFKGAEIALNSHYALVNRKGEKLFDYVVTDTRNIGMNMGAFAGELMRRNLMNFLTASDKDLPGLLAMYKNNTPIKVNYFVEKAPEEKTLLPYNAQHPLNVFHFSVKPNQGGATASGSESGLKVQYQIRDIDGKPEGYVEILPYFDLTKAWLASRENASQTLKYQQVRFKISAFFANELVKELKDKTFGLNEFHQDITELKAKYEARIAEYQKQFDQETAYGANAEALDNWNRKVAFYDAFAANTNK